MIWTRSLQWPPWPVYSTVQQWHLQCWPTQRQHRQRRRVRYFLFVPNDFDLVPFSSQVRRHERMLNSSWLLNNSKRMQSTIKARWWLARMVWPKHRCPGTRPHQCWRKSTTGWSSCSWWRSCLPWDVPSLGIRLVFLKTKPFCLLVFTFALDKDLKLFLGIRKTVIKSNGWCFFLCR